MKIHSVKQRDLFRKDADPKMVKEILLKNNTLHLTSKGKDRSLLGYIRQVKKEKQREHKDEMENAENGGTEYWSTFRR